MKRFLLDSNALHGYIYRRKGVYDRAMSERQPGMYLGTGIPIVAEILAGAHNSSTATSNVPKVEMALNHLVLWPFELPAAHEYARLFAALKKVGVTMQPIDLMVAAIGLTIPHCTIVTCDSDFSRVPGLRVVNWES